MNEFKKQKQKNNCIHEYAFNIITQVTTVITLKLNTKKNKQF